MLQRELEIGTPPVAYTYTYKYINRRLDSSCTDVFVVSFEKMVLNIHASPIWPIQLCTYRICILSDWIVYVFFCNSATVRGVNSTGKQESDRDTYHLYKHHKCVLCAAH